MPALIRSRSAWNLPRTPVLLVTWRKRPCAYCGGRAHVTLYSPSMGSFPRFPGAAGQCCIRCTRGLRSGDGLPV